MRLTLEELRVVVTEMVNEAKKKKKTDDDKSDAGTAGQAYGFYDESLDFSAPLGDTNPYKRAGGVNWGPQTGRGPDLADNVLGLKHMEESVVRTLVRQAIVEATSPWESLSGYVTPRKNVGQSRMWESAKHWYDHEQLGLGSQTPDGIADKKKKNKKK